MGSVPRKALNSLNSHPSLTKELFKSEHHFDVVTGLKQVGLPSTPKLVL